ncbi:MAG: MarR family transcriptional regulator [bacterium]
MSKKTKQNVKEQAAELARLTFLLARACEEKEDYFTKLFNLTNGEFRCMRFLSDKDYLSVKTLSEQMKLTPGRITHIVTGLEQKGYVTREIDTSDRRNIKVRLTKYAIPFMKNVTQKHIDLHERVMKNIPEDIRNSVLLAMSELLNSLSTWSKKKEI